MKSIRSIVILGMFLILPLTLRAQNSISLTFLPGLNTIDFAAFTFTNNLSGSPRIFKVDITTSVPGRRVVIGGYVKWKKDEQSFPVSIVNNFNTQPFIVQGGTRTFFNDELGNSDIKFDQVDGNRDIADEIIKKGRPTGSYLVMLFLFDELNNPLANTGEQTISFLNPAPTISILTPQENSSFDVGNVQALWTPVPGAAYYTVRANALQNDFQSAEETLNSGSPLINDKDVGKVESINLSTILDRQWVGGQRIALAVTAFVTGPGGDTPLRSTPVIFRLNASGGGSASIINPDDVRLGNFLTSRSEVPRDFVNKLVNGQIKVEQITDDQGTTISQADFLNILSFWEAHMESIISVNFLQK